MKYHQSTLRTNGMGGCRSLVIEAENERLRKKLKTQEELMEQREKIMAKTVLVPERRSYRGRFYPLFRLTLSTVLFVVAVIALLIGYGWIWGLR